MGGLGNHVNLQLKRGVKILTCDPASRLIEAETRNGEVITVNAYSYTPMFRWPIPGEKWMVGEENGSWYLEGIYEHQGIVGSEVQVEPGDAVISSSSGRLLVNQEGTLTQIKGSELSVTDYVENLSAAGFVVYEGVTKHEFSLPESSKARFIMVIFGIRGASNFGEIIINGKHIAITERSGSVGKLYRTTLTVVVPPGQPCVITGGRGEEPEFPQEVIIQHLWESVS